MNMRILNIARSVVIARLALACNGRSTLVVGNPTGDCEPRADGSRRGVHVPYAAVALELARLLNELYGVQAE